MALLSSDRSVIKNYFLMVYHLTSRLGLAILLKERNWKLPYMQIVHYPGIRITHFRLPTPTFPIVPFFSTSKVLHATNVLCNIWDGKKGCFSFIKWEYVIEKKDSKIFSDVGHSQ